MKYKLAVIFGMVALVLVAGAFIFSENGTSKSPEFPAGPTGQANTAEFTILKKWELPGVLQEVSGIGYISENRFACVQDEKGSIFIYNTATAVIENEINFAGPGDYEGLTLVNSTAYIIRSDGNIFEVKEYAGKKPNVTEYDTPLTSDHNTEGLGYDKQNNRLLVAIKDDEPNSRNYKGIYAFDLATKKMADEPVYKIDLLHDVFAKITESKKKKKKNTVKPSAIAVHPVTSEIYLTDAVNNQLLILTKNGAIKNMSPLDKKQFTQPEGITFSPAGDVFIANEGKSGTPSIIQVKF